VSHRPDGMAEFTALLPAQHAVALYARLDDLARRARSTAETRSMDQLRADADAVTVVSVRQAFENCPRYIHNHRTGQYSKHCPRPDYLPPDPEWKLKSEYDGIVRRNSGSHAR